MHEFDKGLLNAFLVCGYAGGIFFAICYLLNKIDQNSDDVEELFERVEECENQLKK